MMDIDRVVARLRAIDPRRLPAEARAIFAGRIARQIKVAADARIPEPTLQAVAAWPAHRLRDLAAALDAVDAEIERDRNDRWNDDVRTRVARTYL